MSDYSYQDMMRMQSEAKKRVLEMQKRSRDAAENFNGKRSVQEKKEESMPEELPRIPRAISYPAGLQNQQRHKEGRQKPAFRNPADIRGMLASVFSELDEDDYEKMFILSLCLLLTREGTDDSLVLALMYLLT